MARIQTFSRICITLLPLLLLVTSASLSQAQTLGPTEISWQHILICDQGRAWVDVDLNERRHLQVVSRDAAANQYIASQAVIISSQSNNGAQIAFELLQDTGVFKIADFAVPSHTDSVAFTSPFKIGDDYMTQFTVVSRAFRDPNGGGLKIEFTRATMQICNFYDSSANTCSGGLTYSVRDRYIGNWYFSGCTPTIQ